MAVKELTTSWTTMREGDRFLRYVQGATQRMLLVEREVPDLPQEKGAIGYATINMGGYTQGGVLLIRIYAGDGVPNPEPWLAPFNGSYVADDSIVEFEPMSLVKQVLPGDVRDALRTAYPAWRGMVVDEVTEVFMDLIADK